MDADSNIDPNTFTLRDLIERSEARKAAGLGPDPVADSLLPSDWLPKAGQVFAGLMPRADVLASIAQNSAQFAGLADKSQILAGLARQDSLISQTNALEAIPNLGASEWEWRHRQTGLAQASVDTQRAIVRQLDDEAKLAKLTLVVAALTLLAAVVSIVLTIALA